MTRIRANQQWKTPANDKGFTWDHVQLEVLMDIRDELQKLNRVFACGNFQRIPLVLDEIKRNTKKPRKKPLAP